MVEVKPMHIARFLQKHKDKPTTANRCKRLFSAIWNKASGLRLHRPAKPSLGVETHTLAKRTVYITDEVYQAVHDATCPSLQDALDLAYLTASGPATRSA